jgi:tetratricopeptide (TPR) repeat protein
VVRGHDEDGIAAVNRALELDPLSLNIRTSRGQVLINARRYNEAIEQLQRVIELDPNHYTAHWFLGNAYVVNRQFDEASSLKLLTLNFCLSTGRSRLPARSNGAWNQRLPSVERRAA